tara:strand:+ start:335 stop:1264 length:930 start_codon:yes stop_codon:yes gene_type:complete
MALGTNNTTAAIAGNFIPALWSDEVIGAYKTNLVIANTVTKLSHKGKKGNTIKIPVPNRGAASIKAAGSQVTLSAATNSVVDVVINRHFEYSKLIEDIAEVQALASMRKFYTDDAGHALATSVDNDLIALGEGFNSGTTVDKSYDTAFIGTGTTAFSGTNEAAISDAGIRAFILNLDNADVPMDNRVLIIPPVAANTLLGIQRFTEQSFIGNGDAIKNGQIGQIYGIDVLVSTNCATVKANAGTGNSAAGTERVGIMMHKDALILAEQVGVRTQTQYKQEYLGDLLTADTLYGVKELRNDAGLAFVVPA